MMRLRTLLADDHTVVLQGLRRILDRPKFEVVGAVRDGLALVEAAAELKPDIIIADIRMPLLNGIEAARQIRKQNPKAKIIFLTMHPDVAYAVEAMNAGASGYVVKDADDEELIRAIKRAQDGDVYVTSLLSEPVLNRLQSPALRKNARRTADGLTVAAARDIANDRRR
jgi:DNA-binding NarL/FixJ family response regulator